LDRRDVAETGDLEDAHQKGMGDEVQMVYFVGMLEKHIDAGTVQITALMSTVIDLRLPSLALVNASVNAWMLLISISPVAITRGVPSTPRSVLRLSGVIIT
jgi:hypothetical protein